MERRDLLNSSAPGVETLSRDLAAVSLAISESSTDVIYAKDLQGRIVYANQAALHLIGKPWPEVVGRTDEALLNDKVSAKRVMATDRRIMSRGVAEELEEVVPLPDGTLRIWASRKVPYRDEQGAVAGLLGVSRDVTERRKDMEALARSEARWRRMFELNPIGVVTGDSSGKLLEANEAFLKLVGYSKAQLKNGDIRWDQLTPAEYLPLDQRAIEQVHACGHSDVYEKVYLRADGKRVPVMLACSRFSEGSEELLAFVLDISDRKHAEEMLRQGEERFRALADNIPQLAWMADATGAIHWYNNRWFEYTGTTLEEVRDWGWQCVLHPEHGERVTAKIKWHFAHGHVWEDTFPLRSKTGAYRWFLSRAVPIRNEEGKVIRWFGTNTDVTEQRAAQDALREMDRRKDEFLAMLAHELRNPLAPITSSAALLPMVAEDPARVRKLADVIARQASHMRELIDDLLDVSRVTRGLVSLTKAPVDLRGAIAEALEQTRVSLEAKHHRLELAIATEPHVVLADRKRVLQILSNILMNAVKYTPAGGRIAVSTRCTPDSVHVLVTDNGVGMSSDFLVEAFDLFTQGQRAPDRSEGGLGLGLALVKRLVTLHEGQVLARSDGPGRGSEFELILPRLDGVPEASPPQGELSAHPRTPLRVLIVDDNEDASSVLAMLLEQLGYEAYTEHSAAQALKTAALVQPAVCLLDIGLPDMDGKALAHQLRKMPGAADMVMAAVTGYGQPGDLAATRQAGFSAHFVKPVDAHQLTSWLETLESDTATVGLLRA